MKPSWPEAECRRDLFFAAALVACGLLVMGLFLFEEWRLTGRLDGVPLDDSWIHYRFAENLRGGRGFSFNPGVPTPGSTAPFWVILLSAIGNGYLIPSKITGILAYLASGVLVYFLSHRITASKPFAFLTGLGTLFAGRLAWVAPSGMETAAFTAVSLLALFSWDRSKKERISPWTSLAFGLACTLRPEGYLLLALSGIDSLYSRRPFSRISFVSSIKPVFKHLLIAGLLILPYLVFSLVTTGRVLPNTFYAKSAIWGCQSGMKYFTWIGSVFLLDNTLMAFLAVPGLFAAVSTREWRGRPAVRLCGAWLLTLPFFYGVLAPCVSGYYSRYTTPLIPVLMLFSGLGGLELERYLQAWLAASGWARWRPEAAGRLVRLVMAEGALLGLIPVYLFWAPYFGYSVADIKGLHLKAGRWLAEASRPGEILALNDIGAIGSLADREVIDLMGLTSPEVLEIIAGKGPGEWDSALAAYLASRRPDFLVIFPNWFPGLASQLPARPVYRLQLPARQIAGLPGITVAGGGEMVVYRLDWSGE
jgi:hypothetical protein